ncbi:Copia protein [Eufriesea mexicana]|uniref:Copia protein n=1 Tax=Eufriesea mexicana TaxID=516756 RepID=A0A310SJ54_9HYME|nr:Copia protein [Eufriesea mexicana]
MAIIINTMCKAELLRYNRIIGSEKLWLTIKEGMAPDTEELKMRSRNELSNIKMFKEWTVETFLNRAEVLKDQCILLGRNVEVYDFKIFALKPEEIRRANRKEEETNREYETARKVKERNRTDGNSYNCGIKGHMAPDCSRSKKCFNCQGFNHIAAYCRETNITDRGYDVNFNKYGAILYNKLGGIQMTAVREQNAYYVRTSINLERTEAVLTVNERNRPDKGGEYLRKELKGWFDSNGIVHELSPPMTPECNRIAERANRTIIETTRTMLVDSKLILIFWVEAANTAVDIRNRNKSREYGKTSYEIWYKKQPNIKQVPLFGCIEYLICKGERMTRKAGRPKSVTKEAIQVKKYLKKREQEKSDEQRNVGRSSRNKNQKAIRSIEEKIPTTITEARQSPEWDQWREAVKSEIESLQKHQVWHVVHRPKNKKKLNEDDVSPMSDEKNYQELLGRLMYLSVSTRPNISFALSCLSQFSKNPRTMHMNALKRELRYLKGTINYQMEYGNTNQKKGLKCNTDVSWDRTTDAKSCSCILVCRNGDLVH